MKYLKTIYKNPKNLMVEQTHQQAVRPEKKIKGKILKGKKKKSNSFKRVSFNLKFNLFIFFLFVF